MNLVRGLEAELAAPKYARAELERRWLVDPLQRPPLETFAPVLIEDRYLTDTRMRLRRMTSGDGSAVCKLTKKYETERPESRPIVTTYLTPPEHALLAALPAVTLRKRRYHVPHAGRLWSLDLFEGPLTGLELVEVETADEAALIRELGCTKIQGYYFGRPMDAVDALALFRNNQIAAGAAA